MKKNERNYFLVLQPFKKYSHSVSYKNSGTGNAVRFSASLQIRETLSNDCSLKVAGPFGSEPC